MVQNVMLGVVKDGNLYQILITDEQKPMYEIMLNMLSPLKACPDPICEVKVMKGSEYFAERNGATREDLEDKVMDFKKNKRKTRS